MRQAVYDGAFGARAMYYTRKIDNQSKGDGKAYTSSAFYASGVLELYAHYVMQVEEAPDQVHFHKGPLEGGWLLKKSIKEFREAATAFRNLREHACQIRTELANSTVATLRALAQAGELSSLTSAPDSQLDLDGTEATSQTSEPYGASRSAVGQEEPAVPRPRPAAPSRVMKATPKSKPNAKSTTKTETREDIEDCEIGNVDEMTKEETLSA